MNYSEEITRETMLAPQLVEQLTATTTINSGAVDMSKVGRAFFDFFTGVFGGASPTLSAVGQLQVSPDGTTWTNYNPSGATGVTGTLTAASSQMTFEVRADQLQYFSALQGVKYRYARLEEVCTVGGTSPTIPVAIFAEGMCAPQGPASFFNDASVVGQNIAGSP